MISRAFFTQRLLPLFSLMVFAGTLSPLQAEANGLAATVNGSPITRSEVDESIKIQLRQIDAQVGDASKRAEMKSKLRKEALDTLIDRELILAEYKKLSGGQPIKQEYVNEDVREFIRTTYAGDEKKFLAELKSFGMTLKKFREVREKMLIVQMMRSHASKEVGIATPEKKAKFRRENAELFREPDSIRLRSITINKIGNSAVATPADQKQLIKEIRQRIIKGADFASEAKTYSNDSHAADGGLWMNGKLIGKNDLSSRMSDPIFAVKTGSLSEIIEDEDNFYLFYVEARQPGKSKPADQIEAELERMVQSDERKKLYEQWIARIRAKANIKIF
jgi:peptidyl-prolyl cis-trans isomerase SurA